MIQFEFRLILIFCFPAVFSSGLSLGACYNKITVENIFETRHSRISDISLQLNFKNPIPDKKTFPLMFEFQKDIESKTDASPYSLLDRQKAFFVNFSPETALQFDSIIERQIGSITPIRCLESVFFEKILKDYNGKTEAYGFYFYKITSDNNMVFKLLFVSLGQTNVSLNNIETQIDPLINNGWQPLSHIHNHYFDFENPYGDIVGTLIPSGPDLVSISEINKRFGFKSASITNGIDQIDLTIKDIRTLRSYLKK